MFRKTLALAALGLIGMSASVMAVPITYNGAGLSGVNAATYSFTATGTGPITAYFVGQTAGYGSVIGMLVNGVDTGITGLQNHSSAYGDSLVLGNVTAGDSITFYMLASTDYSGPPTVDYTWYSNPALNSDGLNHIYSSAYGGDGIIPAGTYVGFEDLPGGGDLDYDDHQFVFTGVRGVSVPDGGTTIAMLGLAFAGLGLLRRKL